MITVVIVDDHPVVRAGMRTVLDAAADITVVAEGASGADALRLVAQHRPDVLVLDVNLPDPAPGPRPEARTEGSGQALNGVEVTRQLRDQGHLGLVGIQERVNLIGGTLTLESAPDQGTTLCVEWQGAAD